MNTLVFDIGGTNMRTALLTKEGIGEVTRHKTPEDPYDILSYFEQYGDVDRVVGCFAGILDDEGRVVSSTNRASWKGFAFSEEIGRSLQAEVVIRNDAELAGLGEAVYGAGKGYTSVAYLCFGTGVGTALIRSGAIEPHSSDGAARYGIITLTDNTTLEERMGGHALTETYRKPLAELPRSVWEERTPFLVEGVMNAVHQWSPDVVILGGSLIDEEDGFRMHDIESLARERFNIMIPILRASLKDESGLWGAKALSATL